MKLRPFRRKKKQHPFDYIASEIYKAIDKKAKELGDTKFQSYGTAEGIILFAFLADGSVAMHRVGTWNLKDFAAAAEGCIQTMLENIATGEAKPVQ